MKLTQEQQAIVDLELAPGQILKVIAFAGTGKTSTLVAYAQARPHLRFLYIAFNKSVQMEAVEKFPANVTSRTSHSLAFGSHGYKYKDKLAAGLRANTVMQTLNLNRYEDARFTIDTLNNFLVSADPKVGRRHIAYPAKAFYQQLGVPVPDFIDLANQLGRRMCDTADTQVGMLHDGYLKLYQLSNPVLHYDCILLDEAQDINPVTSALILSQAGNNNGRRPASIILVGDSHQQIYSFRGARDALNHIKASRTMYLTHSFRFGNNIARVANMVLSTFKKETNPIMGASRRKNKPPWDKHNHTIIARTNAALFDRAVKLVGAYTIGFVGGVKSYRLHQLKDIYFLFAGKTHKIVESYIKSFRNYDALRSYAEAVEDVELLSACKVVNTYGTQLPGLVDSIRKKAVDIKDAQIGLTTAHKSKGLEWNNVLLLKDFQELMEDDHPVDPADIEPDEFNLIYVAMTRAIYNLRFEKESSIPDFIQWAQEKIRRKKVQ